MKTVSIHHVVAMRDAHKVLSDGDRGYIFSWDFRRRIAANFVQLEQAIASFEASRNALVQKYGGNVDDRMLPEDHPNFQAWAKEIIALTKEQIELELKPLKIDEFNGDENKTLPADILIKLDPIIEG